MLDFTGGEGGLEDVLGTPGLLVGSLEKKRRKSSTQVTCKPFHTHFNQEITKPT